MVQTRSNVVESMDYVLKMKEYLETTSFFSRSKQIFKQSTIMNLSQWKSTDPFGVLTCLTGQRGSILNLEELNYTFRACFAVRILG